MWGHVALSSVWKVGRGELSEEERGEREAVGTAWGKFLGPAGGHLRYEDPEGQFSLAPHLRSRATG